MMHLESVELLLAVFGTGKFVHEVLELLHFVYKLFRK